MAERSYRGWLWALALIGLTADLSSKYGVFHWLHTAREEYRRLDEDGRVVTYYVGRHDLVPGVFQFHSAFLDVQDAGTSLLSPLRTWGIGHIPEVNHGALFGLGRKYITLANTVFAVVSFLAAGAIIYWSTLASTARDGFLCLALGLILGGTLGNLFDRVVFNGVRDFLYFYWIEWPVFNVADCCLVCGAFLLLAQAFWTPAPVAEPATAETANAV